jgi:hypothetical protein
VYLRPRFICMMWMLYSVLAYVRHLTYSRADDDRAVWWYLLLLVLELGFRESEGSLHG